MASYRNNYILCNLIVQLYHSLPHHSYNIHLLLLVYKKASFYSRTWLLPMFNVAEKHYFVPFQIFLSEQNPSLLFCSQYNFITISLRKYLFKHHAIFTNCLFFITAPGPPSSQLSSRLSTPWYAFPSLSSFQYPYLGQHTSPAAQPYVKTR